jgi:hypothetical protein
VGLELDEYPFITARFPYPLEADMVLAFEPKFFLPEIGMIGQEDTGRITPAGVEWLTHSPGDNHRLNDPGEAPAFPARSAGKGEPVQAEWARSTWLAMAAIGVTLPGLLGHLPKRVLMVPYLLWVSFAALLPTLSSGALIKIHQGLNCWIFNP